MMNKKIFTKLPSKFFITYDTIKFLQPIVTSWKEKSTGQEGILHIVLKLYFYMRPFSGCMKARQHLEEAL